MRALALLPVAVGLVLGLATPAMGQGVLVQPGSASADHFRSAASCSCHDTLTEQWGQSMHVRALMDPAFQAKVTQAEQEAGPAVAAFCKRCHSPIGNMLRDPDGYANVTAAEGVTCMFCHQAVADTGAHANVSQLIVADLTRRAQLKNPDAPHPAAFSAYQQTSEMCGGCHNVNLQANGLHLSTTYSEWAASPYAKNGTTCQDCHMSGTPGVPGPTSGKAAPFGLPRRDIYGMTFIGANVGQGPAEASTVMLKSAAAIRISAPAIMLPGSVTSVTVTITNKGAGHDLPTGLTEERQMWLTVYAEDYRGTRTKLGERHFGTVFEGANGKYPADVWDAVRVHSDDRIPARGQSASAYSFTMPFGADQADVVATLEYRSLSDELAAKAQVNNPTTEMASASKAVYASEAARRALEVPAATTPKSEPSYSRIWIPLLAALAFAGVVGVISFGIMMAQKR